MGKAIAKSSTPEFIEPEEMIGSPEQSNPKPPFIVILRRSLRLHRKEALLAGALTFAAVVGFALTRPKTYQSDVILFVEPGRTNAMSADGTLPVYDQQRYEAVLQQTIRALQRKDVLEDAVSKMPEGLWRMPGEPLAMAAKRLGNSVSAERQGTSFQLDVTMTGSDKNDTPHVLNSMMQSFITEEREEEGRSAATQLQLLGVEKVNVQSDLVKARTEQGKLNSSLGVANLGTEHNPFDDRMEDLRNQLASVRRERDLASSQLAGNGSGTGGTEKGAQTEDDIVRADPGLVNLMQQIDHRRGELQSQMAGMTVRNPLYQPDQRELALLDQQLADATAKVRAKAHEQIQAKLRTQLQQSQDVEAMVEAQLEEQSQRTAQAAPTLQRAAEINENIDRLEGRLAKIDDAMRAAHLELDGPSQIRVQVPAAVPAEAVPGKKKLMLIAALPLALVIGCLTAFLLRKFRGRVYVSDDVKTAVGFPPIAVTPLASDVSKWVQEEDYLRLAAGIESAYLRSAAKTFVFTAVDPSTDIRVMVSKVQQKLAELGYAPAVIPAGTLLQPEQDFRHEHGIRAGLGVIDQGTDGLAAARMAWMKRNHDLVLVEAAPLLLSAETEYAVRGADATILISESGVALIDDLKESAHLLHRLNVTGVGVVIQNLRVRDADPSYQRRVALFEQRRNSERRRADAEETEPMQVHEV